MDTNNTKKSKFKTIIDIITTVLVFVYVIAVILVSFSVFGSMKTGYPSLFGYSMLFVRTDSMESDAEDAIFEGDLVFCEERYSYSDLKVGKTDGDIIAYKATVYQEDESGEIQEHEIVRIHRIVDVADNNVFFITRGDNSEDFDGDGEPDVDSTPVNPINILGVYEGVRVPGIGEAFEFLQTQNGILFFLVIPMAAFFIYALFKFVKAMIEYKLEKAQKEAPADGELTEEQKQAAIAEYLAKQAAEANKDENNTDNVSEE